MGELTPKRTESVLTIEALEQLCECAVVLSANTSDRQVPSWREQKGSLIFSRQVATCLSLLRLLPSSSHYSAAKGRRVWDAPSAASLTRNIIESYCILYYVGIDTVTPEENLFREYLWDYHETFERFEMVRIGLPHSPNLKELEAIRDAAQSRLQGTPHFQQLSSGHQTNLLAGKDFRVLSNVDICQRAGISENYYRSEFKFFSAYVHTAPFAISQGAVFRAGTPEAEQFFKRIFQSALGWMALTVRDFVKLFPDQQSVLGADVRECIGLWEVMSTWEKQDGFPQAKS